MSDLFLSSVAARAISKNKPKPGKTIFDRYKQVTLDRLSQSITALENRLDKDLNDKSVVKSYMWRVINKSKNDEVIEVWLKVGRMLAYIDANEKKLQFSPEVALEWLKDIHSLVSSCEPDKGVGEYLHRLAVIQSWPKTPPHEKDMHTWKYHAGLDKIVPSKTTKEERDLEMMNSSDSLAPK